MTDDWAGVLNNHEKLMWQGRPEPGVRIEVLTPIELIANVLLFGASFPLLHTALQINDLSAFVWWFGGLFFLVPSSYTLFLEHLVKAYVRHRTRYAITTRHALISTRILGRRNVKSCTLLPRTELEYQERGGFSDIYFGEEGFRKVKKSRLSNVTLRKIGFERIAEGQKVFSLLRNVQNKLLERQA